MLSCTLCESLNFLFGSITEPLYSSTSDDTTRELVGAETMKIHSLENRVAP